MLDLDKLLQPVSDNAPCGEDLGYDPLFAKMERSARGKPPQQIGDKTLAGEEPDWRAVRDHARTLLERSKDLRVAMYLTRALLHTEGLSGFLEGVTLIHGLLERYWDQVHPQLDPEDNYDPLIRVNILSTLCDTQAVLQRLREIPLVTAKGYGRFSLRDIQCATGQLRPPAGGEESVPDVSEVDGAFMAATLEEIKETAVLLTSLIERTSALDAWLTNKVVAMGAVDDPSKLPQLSLSDLPELLRVARRVVVERLLRRGVTDVPGAEDVTAGPDQLAPGAAVEGVAMDTPQGVNNAPAAREPMSGAISSPEEVIRALDMVCEYYNRYEPSSPIPLLIERAKRLVSKDFMDIVRDLTPAGVGQAEIIGGVKTEE